MALGIGLKRSVREASIAMSINSLLSTFFKDFKSVSARKDLSEETARLNLILKT